MEIYIFRAICPQNIYYFLKDFIYLFSETGKGMEKARGRDIGVREKHPSGLCPDQESNQQPFALLDDVPTN